MYAFIKNLLFLLSPEKAHHFTMQMLVFISKIPGGKGLLKSLFCAQEAPVEIAGIKFPNSIGLAAGFDKDAKYIDVLALLGFGHIEIGTLTPKPQSGNPKPRLFRLPEDEALINRMGFNNQGVDAAVERLKKVKSPIIIGGNIGKNKITENSDASSDYEYCFRKLYNHVHYFTVNVSSPNTPGLRDLQERPALTQILKGLQAIRTDFTKQQLPYKPIFLKIAPDLTTTQLDEIVEMAKEINLDGLVATNTTISRAGLKANAQTIQSIGNGGLSGKPVKEVSDKVLEYLCKQLKGEIPVIGVGGIHSALDAQHKINKGAAAVQIYTGFIYEGPGLVKRIASALGKR